MKVFKVFLSVVFAIMFVTIFSVAQASDVATKKSQRQVMHDFMKSLVENKASDGIKALDDATFKASNGKWNTISEVASDFIEDCKKAQDSSGNVTDVSARKFLIEYCGIDLSNSDTGSITGKDVGESIEEKTSMSIIPEKTSLSKIDSIWSMSNFSISKVINDIFILKDGVFVTPPPDSVVIFKKRGLTVIILGYDFLNEKEKNIVNGLYSWWIEESLKLIENSYGISFDYKKQHNLILINSFHLFSNLYGSFNQNGLHFLVE